MRNIIVCILVFPMLLSAQKHESQVLLDSLIQKISIAKNDTNKVKLLDKVSFMYSDIDPEQGIKYALQSKALSEKLKWMKGIASGYSDLGINFEAQSYHSKALENHMLALNMYEKLNLKNEMASTLANICLVYMAQSDYSNALSYSFQALKLNEELHNEKTTAIILENIGTIYSEQKKYTKAIEYYDKALKIYDTLHDQEGKARNYGNTAIIMDATGNHAKALQHHFKALEINTKLKDKKSTQINYANIGYVYSHVKNYPKALEYQFIALQQSKELRQKSSMAIDMGNIGETYYAMAMDRMSKNIKADSIIELAIRHLKESIRMCEEISFHAPQIEFGQYLSNACYLSGDYKSAFDIYKQSIALKDTVFSQQSEVMLANLESQRELELKDKAMIIMNKEYDIAKLKVARNRYELIAFIFGLTVLSLIIVGQMRKSKEEKRRHKNILHEISQMQSHVLRAPLARIMGLTALLTGNEPDDPHNKELIDQVSESANELDDIVKKIVHNASSKDTEPSIKSKYYLPKKVF